MHVARRPILVLGYLAANLYGRRYTCSRTSQTSALKKHFQPLGLVFFMCDQHIATAILALLPFFFFSVWTFFICQSVWTSCERTDRSANVEVEIQVFRWRAQQVRRHGEPILHLLFFILSIQVINVSTQILINVDYFQSVFRFDQKYNRTSTFIQTLLNLRFLFQLCSTILRTKTKLSGRHKQVRFRKSDRHGAPWFNPGVG